MFRAVLTMRVREGCENSFEDVWRSAMEEPLPGSLGQAMMCDPKERRLYVITGDWESRDALKAFEQSPGRRAMSAAFEPLRESASKQVLEIIARA
ncbi:MULTISPECIES: antibiotic biosynthesis monooxygenase family protein [Actinomadura]|uniref:Antibiotic biosynthesis monooxygenase family protein n=1 Tax=Actinomadura yumaensis TaxID=111807 RepID=A0ABW2CQ97_9ACTN|nr:antibiotic biosynthesis monooxygenase family protein [Actinomadura sp. J1-007]MWK36692.1 antibiotic biosynthesis monooxygenase [Actinomadura sp. J1-007]